MVKDTLINKAADEYRNAGGKTLLTDLYQLTMNAAYFDNNKNDENATFDLFIRKLPDDWGYYIAAGVEEAIDYATNIKFEQEDIDYLGKQGIFAKDFLEFLKGFKFNGEIYAVKEGTPIAANTPVMRVSAKRAQAQFLETGLLNIINFQTMVATKANRVVNAAKDAKVVDFGLRRAQGEDAAMKGARAAYIGGAVATSNVKAGKEYGIPITGTHAHSFVMGFSTEIEAFRAYVKTFPDNATLLIDTYDTLKGVRNAAIIAKELEKKGKKLGAVRLDSGNLEELARDVRVILNNECLDYVKIVASNDLNEYKIADLTQKNVPIDGYGVGTEMITAKPVAAIPGVYKLVEDEEGAKIKLSPEKATYPGRKQVYRIKDMNGNFLYDTLALENEVVNGTPLLEKIVDNGNRVVERRALNDIRKYALENVAMLPAEVRKLRAVRKYELRISNGLEELIDGLKEKYNHREVKNENYLLECGHAV
ncbi:MAG: nicotinate phosphoribosyltransferase [archaeon]